MLYTVTLPRVPYEVFVGLAGVAASQLPLQLDGNPVGSAEPPPVVVVPPAFDAPPALDEPPEELPDELPPTVEPDPGTLADCPEQPKTAMETMAALAVLGENTRFDKDMTQPTLSCGQVRAHLSRREQGVKLSAAN